MCISSSLCELRQAETDRHVPETREPRGLGLVALLSLWSFAQMRAAPESRHVRGGPDWLPPAIDGSVLLTLWLSLLDGRGAPPALGAGAAVFGGALLVLGASLRVAAIRGARAASSWTRSPCSPSTPSRPAASTASRATRPRPAPWR
jgi:hypothetical protein